MPIRFLKNRSEIAEVSWESPLPVRETNRERRLVQADPLLLATLTVDTTERDLIGNTASEIATIANAGQYRTLIWTGVKTGTADITYTVRARTTDADGQPLGTGWLTLTSGTIAGAAGTWFRITISQPEGLYFDQYRITVQQTSGSQTLISKLVGVRG
ncbi:MAG: hypothetical protein NZ550_01230 [Fimbriimonadales bacterium]|nr:hypothetical protein [Fimbriimonadales bacterium]MDW8051435.1 hypothetical protein [Armatimonadota bacterium]